MNINFKAQMKEFHIVKIKNLTTQYIFSRNMGQDQCWKVICMGVLKLAGLVLNIKIMNLNITTTS